MKNKTYRPRLTADEHKVILAIRGEIEPAKKKDSNKKETKAEIESERKYNELVELLSTSGMFESYEIHPSDGTSERETIPVIQNSDNHIDEIVRSEAVLGLNEYNMEIAERRSELFYTKAVKLIQHHQTHYNIKKMVILMQGDAIGGWIHPELEQTNSVSPNEAIFKFKGMTIAGLKYIHENLDVEKITVVCVCGNHSRETKKTQFANFTDTNKEYWMFLDIANICKSIGLDKIEFIIPKAEMAIISIFNKKYLVAHGHQFRYAGGVGGIFPSMFKWFNNMAKTLKVDAAFIGHWHTSVMTKRVIVNGSPKGYDAYAIGRGLEYERPSQNMTLIDSEYDICLFQQIYLD